MVCNNKIFEKKKMIEHFKQPKLQSMCSTHCVLHIMQCGRPLEEELTKLTIFL